MLVGKNILISSGPTEEPIDPVRVITNKSSGKTGAALARAALAMGANVTVVSGPAAAALPMGADVIPIRTVADMEREMAKRWPAADICIMAAAVSDYRPARPSDKKIHRSDKDNITLELTPNHDILAKLGASKSPGQFLTGFSLESENDVDRADAKMKKKNCDMMVFNRADAALGGDSTAFTLLFRGGGKESFAAMGKAEAAKFILTNIASRIGQHGK
jgi:phosphopantothenoylcysteine decarboxylase/phosphopantothenate--cysteine ligase